jgi:hypothetical protein
MDRAAQVSKPLSQFAALSHSPVLQQLAAIECERIMQVRKPAVGCFSKNG